MVRIKKKYTDFINESAYSSSKLPKSKLDSIYKSNKPEYISELMYDFSDEVVNMVESFPGFFSDMCKKVDASPETDYQEMQKILDKKGWDFESIKNLFSEEANELTGRNFDRWFNESVLTNKNGHCDVYLYFTAKKLGLNKKIVPLGGDGWADYQEPEETFIRYAYGYHQTEYGKLMLNQIDMSTDDFKEKALSQLHIHIEDNLYEIISKYFNNKYDSNINTLVLKEKSNKIKTLINELNFKEISIVEDDRIIIDFVKLGNILEEYVELDFPADELMSEFVKFLSPLKLSIFDVDGDLVIQKK